MGAAIKPHGAAPPVLEFGEHIFHLVPMFVLCFAVGCRVLTLGSGRNARRNAPRDQRRAIGIAVMAFIAQNLLGGRQIRQQCCCAFVVGLLALAQQ